MRSHISGSGHRLGSPAPQVAAAPSVTPTNPPTATKPSVNLDESQPTTSIQVLNTEQCGLGYNSLKSFGN